jgi:hypothetical protein
VHELFHDLGDAGQLLERGTQLVLRQVRHGRTQFVQQLLHPQLAGLVLHDEEHLVVIRAQRVLGIEDLVQVQVVAVAHVGAEIELGVVVRPTPPGFIGQPLMSPPASG